MKSPPNHAVGSLVNILIPFQGYIRTIPESDSDTSFMSGTNQAE